MIDVTANDLSKAEEMMKELEDLSRKSYSLTPKEANQIVNDLGRIIFFLSESNLFPVFKPNSLLPREKKIVIDAIAICFKNTAPQTVSQQTLYFSYQMVRDDFIEDKIALDKNHSLIANPEYWEKITN